MRIHKLKIVLIAASILALGAGVFAGMAVSRLPSGGSSANTLIQDHVSIADDLQLTGPQRDQMRGIWEGVRTNVHHTFDEAQSIQQARDAAIVAILSDSQKARYAALTQEAAERFAALSAQRDQAFHEGVDQTRKILDESQRKRYDRIIRDRLGPQTTGASAGGNGESVAPLPATEPAVH